MLVALLLLSTHHIPNTSIHFLLSTTVDAGHAAILFDKLEGVQEQVYGEGMHFKIPLIQEPIIYNIRVKPRTIDNATQSKDLQTISLSTRVLYVVFALSLGAGLARVLMGAHASTPPYPLGFCTRLNWLLISILPPYDDIPSTQVPTSSGKVASAVPGARVKL